MAMSWILEEKSRSLVGLSLSSVISAKSSNGNCWSPETRCRMGLDYKRMILKEVSVIYY